MREDLHREPRFAGGRGPGAGPVPVCVWLGPPWGATCPRRCSPPTLTHDTLVGFGEVGVSFRWYSGVGGCWGTKRPYGVLV